MTRLRWSVIAAALLGGAVACASSPSAGGAAAPSTARCGPDGHPPMRTEPGTKLIPGQSSRKCPKVEPTDHGGCPESFLEWAETSGGRSRVGPSCLYAAPQRGACEFDSCSCELWDGDSKPPTWSCGAAME